MYDLECDGKHLASHTHYLRCSMQCKNQEKSNSCTLHTSFMLPAKHNRRKSTRRKCIVNSLAGVISLKMKIKQSVDEKEPTSFWKKFYFFYTVIEGWRENPH